MGSFHQTCAITHMAIEYRDPVVGFVLGKSYSYRTEGPCGFTGATPYWQALSLPFRGRYNDYGWVENVAADHADLSLRAAAGVPFADVDAAARENEDVEVDLSYPFGKSKLMAMFVHADVYAALTAKMSGRFGDDVLYAAEEKRLGEFMADAARLAGESVMPPEPGESFHDLSDFVERWAQHTGRNWTETPAVADFFVRNRCEGIHPKLRQGMTRVVARLHAAGRIEEASALLRDCLASVLFDHNLEFLRRQWQPQGGLGSQDTSYDLHAEMAALTARRCEVRSADDYEGPQDEADETAPAP